ncbi:patatin-like phospholipase family protein, partial [Chryseobacterium cucumeris]
MTTENLNKILEDPSLSQASKDKLLALHGNIAAKEFSDLLDQSGNQYIEFVQEGGGVWGSALVGYLYGLEIFGIRFLKVAGTSAGAINTMLIAACKTKEEAKSELIKDILFSWNFADFMDGKTYVKTTLHAMLNNKDFFKINAVIAVILFIILISIPFLAPSTTIQNAKLMFLIPLIPAVILFFCIQKLYNNFRKENSGLNPGNIFQNTMQNALDQFGIKTVAHLNEKFIQKEKDLNLSYRYGNGQEYYL